LNREEVKEIVRKTSEEFFRVDLEVCSSHHMTVMKYPFDHRKTFSPFWTRSIRLSWGDADDVSNRRM